MKTAASYLITFVVGAVCALVLGWYLDDGKVVQTGNALQGQPTTTLACEKLKTYKGKKARRLAHVDKETLAPPNIHLTAAIDIKADGHDYTVGALYNSDDGAITLNPYQHPQPLFAFKSQWRFGAGYGITDEGSAAMAMARYDFLQLKRIQGGAVGYATSNGRYFIGVGAEF